MWMTREKHRIGSQHKAAFFNRSYVEARGQLVITSGMAKWGIPIRSARRRQLAEPLHPGILFYCKCKVDFQATVACTA